MNATFLAARYVMPPKLPSAHEAAAGRWRILAALLIAGSAALTLSKIAPAARADTAVGSVAEQPFINENNAAMAKMMAGMAIKPTGDIDRDFVAMMVPHHQGAIDMAQAELRYGRNQLLLRISQEIIAGQLQEIAAMHVAVGDKVSAYEAMLAGSGPQVGGAALPVAREPARAEGPFLHEKNVAMDRMMAAMTIKPTGDIDRDFVAMMVPHHQGAIDMAQAELRYGHNASLRRIAQEIIVVETQEITLMRLAVNETLPQAAPSPTNPGPAATAPDGSDGASRPVSASTGLSANPATTDREIHK